MVQQNYQEENTNSKNPLWDGNPPWGERISAENLTAREKSVDLKNKKMTEKIGNNLGLFRETSLMSSYWTESSTYVPREEPFVISKIYIIEWNTSEKNYTMWEEDWRKAKTSEAKTNSIVFDIARKGRNSVLYYNFQHEFVPMKRSQESSSPFFSLKMKASTCCLVSAAQRICETKFFK